MISNNNNNYNDIPLLLQLNNYGNNGYNTSISGNNIGQLLKYNNLIDLIPNNSNIAIRESNNTRTPLTFKQLHLFLNDKFDLKQFGLIHKSRIGILLPNGPELAVCLISVISNYCAIPISPQSTLTEIESELLNTKAQAILILSGEGTTFGSTALTAADNLGIGVIMVNPDPLITGLFTLSLLRPVKTNEYEQQQLILKYEKKYKSNFYSKLLNLTSFQHDTISLILHTSGTSGNKKRVPYTLDSLIIGVSCIISTWNLTPNDVNLNMMPLFHIGGVVRNVLSPILSGGSVITCSGFDPVLFWDILQSKEINYNVTWYYAAPTMHHAILQQADTLVLNNSNLIRDNLPGVNNIRFIANAAGALLPALALNLQQTFHATILTGYGMTECMPISSPPQNYNLDPQGTSGIPCGPEVIIVDPDHINILPIKTPGHIMIRGAPCFNGYEIDNDDPNDPNYDTTNEESFYTINNIFGYFDTGDIGYLDENGYLFITGRSKEVINRGGETISPFEIEEALIQHPSIKEACVFSVPHSHYQESIGAIIVMKSKIPRIDLQQLHEYLINHLQRSKWPQVLIYMDNLPKNNTNKILRIKLAERMNLNEINDEMTPISRTYFGHCPIIGTPLKVPIAIESIHFNLNEIEDFITTHTSGIKGKCKVIKIDFTGRIDTLVAFITPYNNEIEDIILKKCQQNLHGYMCPYLIISLDEITFNEAINNPSKLNLLAIQRYTSNTLVLPRNPIETQIEIIWRTLLNSSTILSVTTSFFDLGGDSLQAGQLVNAIRKKMNIQLSVADLFLAPTIEKLSHKISTLKTLGSPSPKYGQITKNKKKNSLQNLLEQSKNNNSYNNIDNDNLTPDDKFQSWEFSNQNYSNTSFLVLFIQSLPLLFLYPLRRIIIWFTIAIPWVYLMESGYGRFESLITAIILSRLFGGIMNPMIGIISKWLIIGKYKPGRYPLWGLMYLRWWFVEQVILIFGKGFFRDDIPIIGFYLVRLYYILMGAKIGKNVRIHKDAKLGQADLLTIGDNVVIDVAIIRPFSIEEGHMILLPINIGNNCSVGLKSSIAPGTNLSDGTCIGPLSSSHEIDSTEEDDRKYCRTSFSSPPIWMIIFLGIPILTLVLSVSLIPWYFGLKYMVWNAKTNGWYVTEIHSVHHAFMWWITPERLKFYFFIRIIKRCIVPIIRLIFVILIKWIIIGKFQPISGAEKQTSWNRFRYWLMSKLLPGGKLGGVSKLVGTHYEIISIIFRALGAKVGKRVYWPGSGLEIVEYDLLDVGNDVVFGSRSVVLTSSSERSAPVIFEDGSMIADRCVILPGLHLKKAAVLGSGSLAPEDFVCPIGSIWVGSRDGSCINVSPEDLTYEVKDTISPFGRAFYEGKAPYTVIPLWGIILINLTWQAFCTCYHNAPTVLSLSAVSIVQKFDHENIHHPIELFQLLFISFVPVFFLMTIFSLLFDICAKWYLLGRRKQGAYPWDQSNYCQNWQLYLTLEEIRRGENGKVGVLDMLRGSQYLVWYFRLLGANIGKNVCLYPNGGDPMMTEPDLVSIGDGASVDDASLIAHINTRGIFRLNPVIVGKNCVLKSNTRLLSGAQMSDYSIMQEHTLVLAGDTVDSGSVWQGWPSNQIIPLEIYRKYIMDLVTKSVFQSQEGNNNGNNGNESSDRLKQRQNDRISMIEESKSSKNGSNFYQSDEMKIPIDSLNSTQKKVSFKNSPISPLSSILSTSGSNQSIYSSPITSTSTTFKTPPTSASSITSSTPTSKVTPSPGIKQNYNNNNNNNNHSHGGSGKKYKEEDKETTPLLPK